MYVYTGPRHGDATATSVTPNNNQCLLFFSLSAVAVRESDNYTCWARSSGGVDSLTHQVVTLTPPAAPSLSLSHATYNALNLTITPAHDGGAPILGECSLGVSSAYYTLSESVYFSSMIHQKTRKNTIAPYRVYCTPPRPRRRVGGSRGVPGSEWGCC